MWKTVYDGLVILPEGNGSISLSTKLIYNLNIYKLQNEIYNKIVKN